MAFESVPNVDNTLGQYLNEILGTYYTSKVMFVEMPRRFVNLNLGKLLKKKLNTLPVFPIKMYRFKQERLDIKIGFDIFFLIYL